MSISDTTRQIEAEGLAHAQEIVQAILLDWNWMTWDEILDEDVVLFLKLGSVGIDQVEGFGVVGGKLRVVGRHDAKRVLKAICDDLRRELSVTTAILCSLEIGWCPQRKRTPQARLCQS
jgi:hypothetical protein